MGQYVVISLPNDAKPLTVAQINTQIFLWALVETNNPPVDRAFALYLTGERVTTNDPLTYVGTFFKNDPLSTPMVYHIFEVIKQEGR